MYMLWDRLTLHTRGNYPDCQWQGEAKLLRHPPFIDIDITSSIACHNVTMPIFCKNWMLSSETTSFNTNYRCTVSAIKRHWGHVWFISCPFLLG